MRPRGLLLLCLALSPAAADEETALYFVSRARESLAQGDHAKTEHWLQRALEEEKDYPPAHLVYAELEEAKGDRKAALARLSACVSQEGRDDLSADEERAVRDARAKLKRLDAARFEFERIVDGHVKQVLALAESEEAEDRELAMECWRTILLVDPENAEAKARLAAPGLAIDVEKGKPLFNGKNLEGWAGNEPVWTVRGGLLVGSVADAANVNRTKKDVKGDFSIVCELRVVKDIGKNPLCGVVFGLLGSYEHFGLWIWPDSWRLEHSTGEDEHKELHRMAFKGYKGDYDRFSWNTYRIDVEGKRVTGFVNGRRIWSTSGAVRSLDGFVGCWVQEQEIEIRKFILVRK